MKRLLAGCAVMALTLVPVAVSAQANLSTSTKTVVDVNGGEPDPGDVVRYTVTLVESAGVAATAVRVVDDLAAELESFAVVSVPPGAIDASTGTGTGANGTGRLDVGTIFVPANGSAAIVFEARIAAGTPPATPINNTATVTNLSGPGATPAAPQLIVSPSAVPSSGTKPLYLLSAPGVALSRNPPAASPNVTVAFGAPVSFTLTPNLALPLALPAGNISVPLWLRRAGGDQTRTLQVTLANTVTGVIGSATQTLDLPVAPTPTPGFATFVIPNPASATFPAGSAFRVTLTQTAPTPAGRTTLVHTVGPTAGTFSHVLLNSATVVNVNSVQTFSAAYPGGAAQGSFSAGGTVYVRAVISDPFGSFDIASARISIIDAASVVRVADAPMPQVADSGGATRTYEFAYVVPAGAPPGGWSARVTGVEGTEGVVTHTRAVGFVVLPTWPALRVTKNVDVLSDPVNGAVNPLQIPGSLQRYRVTVTNTGVGFVDASTLVIADIVPANVELVVAGGAEPVQFVDGTVPSGLTFAYATNVTFSNQPGGAPPYDYVPVPNANGVDPNVTALRIAPAGAMAGAASGNDPSFSVEFRVRVR
jgi:trimeric autotransporter adhesin